MSGDLSATLGALEGIYSFGGYANEMEYWVYSVGAGSFAIWYYPDTDTGYNWWALGSSDQVGTFAGYMFAGSTEIAKECPTYAGWTWQYHDGTDWVETNDLSLECTGKIRNMLEVFV